MGRVRLGSLAWLGSILAGFGLGAYVLAAWPEPTVQPVRLPYGESMPKTPRVPTEREAPIAEVVTNTAGSVTSPQAQVTRGDEAQRELAGPPPVASQLERDGYRQETAEELGATFLPGMGPNAAPTP